jgi:hypothetical protein
MDIIADMVWIPGATFRMGSDSHYPEERPVHRVSVDGFWIDREPVTNARFAKFVDETGHVTFAEIPPRAEDYPGALPDQLFAGSLVFTACRHPVITLTIASANFPDQRFGATVILYLLVGLVLLAPYVKWSRAQIVSRKSRSIATFLVAWLGVGLQSAWAQETAKEPPELGWSNSTDLSLVLTAGNSAAQTWGVSDELRHDDRFFLIAPGLEFPVGGAPSDPATSLVKPDPILDVANYLTRGSYERNITPRFFWNVGASWDRSNDAGILNRYITHAGVGNTWVD